MTSKTIMMNSENYIKEKVEAAMRSLDGLQRADAPPFLHTRVQAALRAQDTPWERILQFLSRPVVAFGVLVLILLLNGSIVAWKTELVSGLGKEETRQQEFAEDYNLAVSTFYDYENK